MGIKFRHKGDYRKATKYLEALKKDPDFRCLAKYGLRGVEALTLNTPVDTGKTAISWTFDIVKEKGSVKLVFKNTNVNKGENIALLIQYGHGTRNGGYVVGRDYINPAIRPVFDQLADEAWKEVVDR